MGILTEGSHFSRFEELGRNPAVLAKLRFLEFGHLRSDPLRNFSSKFAELAVVMLDTLPDDAELTLALDALRQAKDRAVGLMAVSRPPSDGEPQG